MKSYFASMDYTYSVYFSTFYQLVMRDADFSPVWSSMFEYHCSQSANQCFVCNLSLGEVHEAVSCFTCNHGNLFHPSCAAQFYEILPFAKQCLSSVCHHAQIINPKLSARQIFTYRTLFQLLQSKHLRQCTICDLNLLPDSLVGFWHVKSFRYATCGKHVAHPGCQFLQPKSSCKACQKNMNFTTLSIKHDFSVATAVEKVRLYAVYPKKRQFPLQYQPVVEHQKINHAKNAKLVNLILRVQHSAKVIQDLLEPQTCSICFCTLSSILAPPGETISCSHYNQMHTHCLEQWLSKNATCPICRRTIKL